MSGGFTGIRLLGRIKGMSVLPGFSIRWSKPEAPRRHFLAIPGTRVLFTKAVTDAAESIAVRIVPSPAY